MAYRILAERLTGEEKAFSEDNLLILSAGPLTGTGVPGSDRFEITGISPKSGEPVSSNCGGSFGVFLKKAGLDAVILRGRCKSRRWLEIGETGVRFHDATDLWGKGTVACSRQLATHCSSCLCIFTVGATITQTPADAFSEFITNADSLGEVSDISFAPVRLLCDVTGMSVDPMAFLTAGNQSRNRQEQLYCCFRNRKELESSAE